MKKYKYSITLLSLFLLLPAITYAECSTEELQAFKKIEKEYKYTYKLDKETKTYTITFTSPQSDKYDFVIDDDEVMSKCKAIDKVVAECYDVPAGEYDISIVGVTNMCNSTLKTDTIKLATYNTYADDPLCEGIEEFVLCQPTYDKEIDRDTFVSRVNTYKKTKQKEENVKEENNQVNEILEYIEDNLLQIIIIAVFAVMVIITVILTAKSIKKSRRLE